VDARRQVLRREGLREFDRALGFSRLCEESSHRSPCAVLHSNRSHRALAVVERHTVRTPQDTTDRVNGHPKLAKELEVEALKV
jgi:hypothetical protein